MDAKQNCQKNYTKENIKMSEKMTVPATKTNSLSEKLCDLSERHKGLLALLITITAASCVVICGLILLAFGTSSVAAYHHSLGFVETTCVVTNSTFTGEKVECNCRDVCRSVYPCLQVQVQYSLQHDDTVVTSTLYHTDLTLNHKCSYEPDAPCSESADENEHDVHEFHCEFGGLGANYSCLYNPHDSNEVILKRAASTSEIVTMVVWPSVLLVLAVVIIIMAHCYVGARNICEMFKIINKKEAPTSFTKKPRLRRKPLLLHPV